MEVFTQKYTQTGLVSFKEEIEISSAALNLLSTLLIIALNLLLTRPSQDVFLLPWIEQGGSILLVTFLYNLCDGLTNHLDFYLQFLDHSFQGLLFVHLFQFFFLFHVHVLLSLSLLFLLLFLFTSSP